MIINDLIAGILESIKQNSYSYVEKEIIELENIFLLLIAGGFIGYTVPISLYSVELLPYLQNEITILISRIDDDTFCRIVGMFDPD